MGALQAVGPPILAFLLAGLFAAVELLTTKYQHTYFLLLSLRRCWPLYIYTLIYAAIGAILAIILSYLVAQHILRIEGLGLDQPWIRAIYVGIATKSFLQFSLFSVGEERVGIATVTKMFEPPLLRSIDLDEDHFVKEYLRPYVDRYPDIRDVRQRIIADIPASMPDQERKALELDIGHKVGSSREAMSQTLRQLGRRALTRIFPL